MNDTLLKLWIKLQTITMREEGQDLVEYALVVGLISVAAVGTLNTAASTIKGVISTVTTALASA